MIKTAQHLVFSLIVLAAALCGLVSAQTKTIPADPSFKLQGLDGKVYDLAELRGSVVLVSFGATWCAPCSSELRMLDELLSEYHGEPVKFFWVSIERPEEVTNRALRRYANERRVTF